MNMPVSLLLLAECFSRPPVVNRAPDIKNVDGEDRGCPEGITEGRERPPQTLSKQGWGTVKGGWGSITLRAFSLCRLPGPHLSGASPWRSGEVWILEVAQLPSGPEQAPWVQHLLSLPFLKDAGFQDKNKGEACTSGKDIEQTLLWPSPLLESVHMFYQCTAFCFTHYNSSYLQCLELKEMCTW